MQQDFSPIQRPPENALTISLPFAHDRGGPTFPFTSTDFPFIKILEALGPEETVAGNDLHDARSFYLATCTDGAIRE